MDSDEFGTQIAVNQVLISLTDGRNTRAEAERLAGLVDGEIVGQIPLISAYQLLLKTRTLAELEEVIERLEADSSVKYAVENFTMSGSSDERRDWPGDPGWIDQRASNRVVEGAEEYVSNVHPTDDGKIRPSRSRIRIGVVE